MKKLYFIIFTIELLMGKPSYGMCCFKSEKTSCPRPLSSREMTGFIHTTRGLQRFQQLLDDENIDINACLKCKYGRFNKKTPLTFLMTECGAMRALLNSPRIEVNKKDAEDNTPLIAMIKNGSFVDSLLCHQDLNFNAPDSEGITPLLWSIMGENQNLFDYLLKCPDVDLNASAVEGITPLIAAINCNRPIMFKDLANKACVEINKSAQNGRTPLIYAVIHKNDLLSEILNHPDVDITIDDDDGYTALDWAVEKGNQRMVKSLLNHAKRKHQKIDVEGAIEIAKNESEQEKAGFRKKQFEAIVSLLRCHHAKGRRHRGRR